MGYKIQNIRFFLSATWAFPLNPSTVVSDPRTYEEELKNGFYLSTGVRLTFKKKYTR
jgi:hypothetical protein